MTPACTRRDLVRGLSAASLYAASGSPALAIFSRADDGSLESLATDLLATPRDELFAFVEARVRDGLRWDELLGALFVAGIREIRPRPVGNKLHAVLVVESVFQLVAASPPRVKGAAVLWNLGEIQASLARDERQGDWTLCPPAEASFASRAEAEEELRAALRARDAQRTDRAVVGLNEHGGRRAVMEVLWPWAAYEHVGLCHRTLFAAHVDRTLDRVGERYAEPALRALAYGLLEGRIGGTAWIFGASREAAQSMRADWTEGERAPQRSLALAREIRRVSSPEAGSAILAASEAGLHPDVLWDALRLAAADLFERGPGLLAVHATTVTCALHHVFRVSGDDATRRLALLQAAAWMPLFRERFEQSLGIDMDAPGIDALLDRPGTELSREHLFRGADENHQAKYAAAILEGAQHTDPRWRGALLAPARAYLPDAGTSANDLHERATALLDRLES